MAIIDLDSHLRDGWLLDEIYKLPEPFAKFSPKRIGDGKYFHSKFEHALSPMQDPIANANFKKPVTHQVFYDPEANQRGRNQVQMEMKRGAMMAVRATAKIRRTMCAHGSLHLRARPGFTFRGPSHGRQSRVGEVSIYHSER